MSSRPRSRVFEVPGSPGARPSNIARQSGAIPSRVSTLEIELSEADAVFLEGLANDRSERVQAIARAYLARLGRSLDTIDLAAELTGMVDLGKVGLIHRRTCLIIKPLKTPAQNARRHELFKLVSLGRLARALGVSEMQLTEAPPDGAADGIDAFVAMVAATGSDAARRALLDCMLADASCPASHLRALAPRLSAEERRALLPRIMTRDDDRLDTALAVAGRELGATPVSAMLASPAYQSLQSLLESALDGADSRRAHDNAMLAATLNRIALLLDASGAADMLSRVVSWGSSPADPKLDLLHLNAALTTETIP